MRASNKEYSKHKGFFENFHNLKFVQFCDFRLKKLQQIVEINKKNQ